MLYRYSSRNSNLFENFLKKRLNGATRYDRIAGYFQSSLLELASEELAEIPSVRIVCNTEISAEDVRTVRLSTGVRRNELEEQLLRLAWNSGHFTHLVDVHGHRVKKRLANLHNLISKAKLNGRIFEIRIVPDSEFGFLHGKGGVIEGDWGQTSFIGSANDSTRAWTENYELVWEDDSQKSVVWMQEEFNALWEKGFPLSEFIVKQIHRLSRRTILESIEEWKEKPSPETVLAEVPTATRLFGFWDHQKFFIKFAFEEHLKYQNENLRGSRFLLCDSVGLGKTLQLGAIAKLIGTFSPLPILIVVPKTLMEQWQDELLLKLNVPSARWDKKGWITESNEFHPTLEGRATNCPRKVGIISTSVVTSATISTQNKILVEQILKCRFSCVLWDEAHKIRRKNLSSTNIYQPAQKNLLYEFAEKLAGCTKSMLLATATPIQLHPMELWDLLYILSINNPQVLGDDYSLWQISNNSAIFDIVCGRKDVSNVYEKWTFWRNPLPMTIDSSTEVFQWVRLMLDLEDTDSYATNAKFDRLDSTQIDDLSALNLRDVNPFTQRVIKRSRERLEQQGKLVQIEMQSFGDDQPITCTHSMELAFDLASDFAKAINKRVNASGFLKTLLQRRIGSSLFAGLRTTQNMLNNHHLGKDEDPNEDAESIYPLEDSEITLLNRLKNHLKAHLEIDDDPKFVRVLDVLQQEFEGRTWLDRGVLIFSQFYDSARALCEYLCQHTNTSIGLYASAGSSILIEAGIVHSVTRELLKEQISQGRLKLVVGTDAASIGLNFQYLGCLVNLDLPWNPTILEQRKGRVQRGMFPKKIPFYNMRYDKGVEQHLFNVLSNRIQDITDIFGTIPDFIIDEWIKDMLDDKEWDEQRILNVISDQDQNPFTLKETKESVTEDWDNVSKILNEGNALRILLEGWPL